MKKHGQFSMHQFSRFLLDAYVIPFVRLGSPTLRVFDASLRWGAKPQLVGGRVQDPNSHPQSLTGPVAGAAYSGQVFRPEPRLIAGNHSVQPGQLARVEIDT